MKLSLCGLILLVSCGLAQARLGDTPAQCISQYGKPVGVVSPERMIFQTNGWNITVLFTNGTATGEQYVKVRPAELGLSDLVALLKLEAGNQAWSAPSPDTAGGVQLSCGQLAASLSRDRTMLLVGSRESVAKEQAVRLNATPGSTPGANATGADDTLTTVSGKTYKGARFHHAGPLGITIFHAAGVAAINLNELPENWRAKYADAVAAATPEPSPVAEQPADTSAVAATDYGAAGGGYSGGSGGGGGSTYVHGYTRKDGTYVHSYTRGGGHH